MNFTMMMMTWCVVLLKRHSSIVRLPGRYVQAFITRGGKGRGDTSKESKATKSKGRGLEEGASRALMRQVEAWRSSDAAAPP